MSSPDDFQVAKKSQVPDFFGCLLYVEIACNFLDRTQHLQLFVFDALYIRMLVTVNKNKSYDLIINSKWIYGRGGRSFVY